MKRRVPNRYPIDQSRLYRLRNKGRLAELLGTDLSSLRKLAARSDGYRVFLLRQDNGKNRIIEEPMPELKKIHSKLADLLARIEPPVYLHSGTKGRSYLSNAASHFGKGHVIKTDISKFYPSTTSWHVFIGLMREFKCSGDVARLLADLCTYEGHVPTGSPASMPIAFYAHKQIFDQVYRRMHAHGITMTVYVDDLTFSGEQLMRLHLCPVRKAFQAVGLICHKTSAFEKHEPKLVTGAVITRDGMRLPNKRHLKIAEGIRLVEAAPSQDDLKVARARLLGRINEAAAVDERYKRKLHGLKCLIERIAARTSERLAADFQYKGA